MGHKTGLGLQFAEMDRIFLIHSFLNSHFFFSGDLQIFFCVFIATQINKIVCRLMKIRNVIYLNDRHNMASH